MVRDEAAGRFILAFTLSTILHWLVGVISGTWEVDAKSPLRELPQHQQLTNSFQTSPADPSYPFRKPRTWDFAEGLPQILFSSSSN
jgi:hypothetical protein